MSDEAIGYLTIIASIVLTLGIGITFGSGPARIATGVLLFLVAVAAVK